MNPITLIAITAFGLEAVVKREVQALGFEDVRVSEGKVEFEATLADIPRANLWLRSADRVLLKMGEFPAVTFDELFEQTKALPWEAWIPQDGAFPVAGKAVKSTLGSVRACQSIVKKAVVERLQEKHTKPHGCPKPAPPSPSRFPCSETLPRSPSIPPARACTDEAIACRSEKRRCVQPWPPPWCNSASGTKTACSSTPCAVLALS